MDSLLWILLMASANSTLTSTVLIFVQRSFWTSCGTVLVTTTWTREIEHLLSSYDVSTLTLKLPSRILDFQYLHREGSGIGFQIGLMWGAHTQNECELDPGSHGCDFSILPLIYPATPQTNPLSMSYQFLSMHRFSCLNSHANCFKSWASV